MTRYGSDSEQLTCGGKIKWKLYAEARPTSPQPQSFWCPFGARTRQDFTLPREKLWFLSLRVKVPVWVPLSLKCELPYACALRANVGHRSLGQASGESVAPVPVWRKQTPWIAQLRHGRNGDGDPCSFQRASGLSGTQEAWRGQLQMWAAVWEEQKICLWRFHFEPPPQGQAPRAHLEPQQYREQTGNATFPSFWKRRVPLYGSQEHRQKRPGPRVRKPGLSFCLCQ